MSLELGEGQGEYTFVTLLILGGKRCASCTAERILSQRRCSKENEYCSLLSSYVYAMRVAMRRLARGAVQALTWYQWASAFGPGSSSHPRRVGFI
jgi:hypothetical protein